MRHKARQILLSFILLNITSLKSQTYTVQDAVSYAETWTCDISNASCDPLKHNPAYNYYSDNDCANFMSQCLIAGGLSLNAGPGIDKKNCIPFCDNLHQNLINHQNVQYQRLIDGTPTWFSKGDVVMFGNNSSDYWKHACFAVTSSPPLLNAHTNNRYHRPISYYYGSFANADFYHILSNSCSKAANNLCGNAIELTPSASCNYNDGTTCGATPISPIPSPSIDCYLSASLANDVWYKFVAAKSKITVKVEGGSEFQPIVQVLSNVVCASSYKVIECDKAGSVGGIASASLSDLTVGATYWVRVYNTSGLSGTDFKICIQNSITSNCTDQFESNNSPQAATTVFADPLTGSSNYSLEANLGFQDDVDWYKVDIGSCGKLTVNLSNLPYNYQLELWRWDYQAVYKESLKSGTKNEQVTFSYSGPTNTAYIKIYSANPGTDFTTSSCYDLQFIWEPCACAPPDQPKAIRGSEQVCQGSSQIYSIPVVQGANNYTWSFPDGWSTNSSTNSVTTTAGNTGGFISVTANNDCGSSSPSTLDVSIIAKPEQPSIINGSHDPCEGSFQTYSVQATGDDSYVWNIPTGWSGSSTKNSILLKVGGSSGVITVSANNACGAGLPVSKSVTASKPLSKPDAITGNTQICEGVSQTYSIPAVPGATSYQWTLPAGWEGSSSTASLTVTPGPNNGTISVTATNGCGESQSTTMAVSVTALPQQPSLIVGPSAPCRNSIQTYSIPTVIGATNGYTWTLPSGWEGISTNNSIKTTVGNNNGVIYVRAKNSCGESLPSSISVISSVPLQQPSTISGNSPVCQSSSQSYSVNAVSGATYKWTLPTGWSGASSSNSIPVIAGNVSGTITVAASNSCGTTTPQSRLISVTSLPPQPGAISGLLSPCKNSVQTYSVASVATATSYIWTLPSGWTGSSTTNSISTTVGNTNGLISVKARNGCGNSVEQTLSVAFATPLPQPTIIIGRNNPCQSSKQLYSVIPVSGATSYLWKLPVNWAGLSSTNSITATIGSSNGPVSVQAQNSCGNGIARQLSVVVKPAIKPIATITEVGCLGNTVSFKCVVTNGGTAPKYEWVVDGVVTGGNTPELSVDYAINGMQVLCKVTSNAACATPATVTSNPVAISCAANPLLISPCLDMLLVFPNPGDNFFIIKLRVSCTKKIAFKLLNASGQIVRIVEKKEINGYFTEKIPISDLPSGNYYLQTLIDEEDPFTKPLLIIH